MQAAYKPRHEQLLQPEPLAEEPASGLYFGPYQIQESLGRGGMSEVLRAFDYQRGLEVALKLPLPSTARDEAKACFFREFQLARSVRHRNVVRMIDFGELRGIPHVVMECIQGETLRGVIRNEGSLRVADALHVTSELCSGLSAVHDGAIIHCDIKPENILVADGGRFVLTDFGVARRMELESRVSAGFCGTPTYMAPEQVTGEPASLATDVYAVGVVLYELLTGRTPWVGDIPNAVALARIFTDPADPRDLRPSLPAPLCALVMRCLSRAPERRFASARDLGCAIAGLALM